MKRIARLLPLIVLLFFVAAAIIYSESLKTRVQVGAAAPAFELPALDGGTVRLEDFRGQPVYVNFWAAWCEPCLEELPAHDEFYRRYGDRVAYLAVNERETVARIERHLRDVEELGLTMTLPILLDRRGTVGEAYRLGGMPETWLIDADGIARHQWVGVSTFEQLQAGYYIATGQNIDALDGGPFYKGGARAVLLGVDEDGRLTDVFVGGEGGLARYDVRRGGAALADYVWEAAVGETVLAVKRTGAAASGAFTAADGDSVVVTEDGFPGLPAAPTSVAQDTGGYALAWVPGHGLYGREPGGGWRLVPTDLVPQMPWADLDPDPFAPGRWLMATGAGLLESRDDGRTWRATNVTVRTYAVRHDPTTPGRVFVATDTGVWISDDGGRTATRIPGSPQRVLAALDLAVTSDGATWLAAAAPNGDVYVSAGAGDRWRLIIPYRDR